MAARKTLETSSEAAERRSHEVRQIIAEEIPHNSSEVSFGFAKREFVQAIITAYKRKSENNR
jgi:hypothetical protein